MSDDTKPYKPLTCFKGLSFDCFGTLIDWEGGVLEALQPILSRLPPDHTYAKDHAAAVQRFNAISNEAQAEQPGLQRNKNLAASFRKLAGEVGVPVADDEAEAMGGGPGRWPAFPDTVAGLQVLRKRFRRLLVLSNIDDANAEGVRTGALAGVQLDAFYTAEGAGSYKPSHETFEYLFRRARDEQGVDFAKGELLHVARSLTADQVPAKEIGLPSVWISRGGDRPEGYGVGGNLEELRAQGKLAYEWRFDTIGDFAREVERQFAQAEEGAWYGGYGTPSS